MSYYVYIIGRFDHPKPCKIGISRDPEVRKTQLQTASPDPLALLWTWECESKAHARAIEAAVHERFAEHRLSGEWFDLTSEEIVKGGVWDAQPSPAVKKRAASPTREFEPFHPTVPDDLLGVRKRDMSYADRCRYWEAYDLPPPPDGFDDWYVVGNPKNGVLGAFPVVGFMDEAEVVE